MTKQVDECGFPLLVGSTDDELLELDETKVVPAVTPKTDWRVRVSNVVSALIKAQSEYDASSICYAFWEGYHMRQAQADMDAVERDNDNFMKGL